MRKLLLMRGIPGSGKSYWLDRFDLKPYTICPDDLRLLFRSPVLSKEGTLSIDGANDKRVWEMVYSLLEERMNRGEFVVIDATHKKQSDFSRYQKLANTYMYDIACVDFSEQELNQCVKRNYERKEYKRVPGAVIAQHHNIITQHKLPKNITVIKPEDTFKFEAWMASAYKHSNLNAFKKIHHIGDIQGCFEPIKEYFKDGFNEDEFYIFTGDLLDRGIQNGLVLDWALSELLHRDNVVMMMGNHERHLLRYVNDMAPIGQEFPVNTVPQIAHVDKKRIKELLDKTIDCFIYTFHGRRVIVSHGGLGKIPDIDKLPYIASKTFWNGAGVYADPIDELFSKYNTGAWTQVHGHRNRQKFPLKAGESSFNLEGKVEFGGHLRTVTLQLNEQTQHVDFIEREIINTVHKTNDECLPDY